MIKQRTLKKIARIAGIGLHTGKEVKLTLYPAKPNTGIIYRRIDLKPPLNYYVNIKSIGSTVLCTCLKNKNGTQVCTVEHLSAAQSGLGIDNAFIELDAPEVPILDGSAADFVSLLLDSGIEELDVAKKFIKIKKIVRVEEGDKWVELRPHIDGLILDFTIDYNHPAINMQHYFLNFSTESFINEISQARTFGFISDFLDYKNRGFALGASLDSVIIFDDYGVLNKEGLRFADELVRHKILDAIGDLFMCGYNLIGSFVSFKSGHTLHSKLLKSVFSNEKSWELITMTRNIKNT